MLPLGRKTPYPALFILVIKPGLKKPFLWENKKETPTIWWGFRIIC
jgi:hypothetical protein